MSKPTPSELRQREKEIGSFETHWYIDTVTAEIRHKPLNIGARIIDLFWRRKHKVSDMYWWSMRKWYGWEMMPYPVAIKHDDVPIAGFPRKHQMQNGWTIPSDDLMYLYEGPLVDETGKKILVKHQSTVQKYVTALSQLRPLSWAIPFALACYRYRIEISELWKQLVIAI